MNGDKKYRGKFEYPMGVEPMDDPPQSVESERKIIDSNPIRGTFVHANTGAVSTVLSLMPTLVLHKIKQTYTLGNFSFKLGQT